MKKMLGMELAEKGLNDVLLELGVLDEEKRKEYQSKILSVVMIGLLMDSFSQNKE